MSSYFIALTLNPCASLTNTNVYALLVRMRWAMTKCQDLVSLGNICTGHYYKDSLAVLKSSHFI